MKKLTILLVIIMFFYSCKVKVKQETTKEVTVNNNSKAVTITSQEIKEKVSFLASDDLKGRNTGTKGIETAASNIETTFKNLGLKPYFKTYRDSFKVKDINAYNVVGYLEGNDAKLKDQFIIIGAHYDHIGTAKEVNGDTIANGANDNASGTSSVLALAKYFSAKNNNKRSIMFVTFTAEEKGLLGSKHLAKKLQQQNFNLYTMINIEMVGVPFKDRSYEAFLTGYKLSNLAEKINTYAKSEFVGFSEISKKYNLFKRSDNYPFYEQFKVPCHTFSSCDLSNFDFYHHVDDEVDKLDYTFMANLINKTAPIIEQMANAPTQEIKMNDN